MRDTKRQTKGVKVDVRTIDGQPMTAKAATLPVGSALRIAPSFVAQATLDSPPVTVTVMAKYVAAEGRYITQSVTADAARDDVEVNSRLMRTLPIGRVVQAAALSCIALTLQGAEAVGAEWFSVAELTTAEGRIIPEWIAKDAAARGQTELRMDIVEILYGTAALAGEPPTKLIQEELAVPHRTASDWISKARAAGRLEGMTSNVGRKANG